MLVEAQQAFDAAAAATFDFAAGWCCCLVARAAVTSQAAGALLPILKDPAVDTEKRVQLEATFCASRMLFSAGSWDPLPATSERRLGGGRTMSCLSATFFWVEEVFVWGLG